MKKTLMAITMGAVALGTSPAFGHGAEPEHGGFVASANDLSYELVADGTGATIYVVYHDEPVDTGGMGGKLTVLNGSDKSEVDLKPAGGNKLETKPVRLDKGAKAVASLASADGKVKTVRFSLR